MLGSLLVHGEVARQALDLLASDDFYRRGHQKIYCSMARVVEDGLEVDFVTVRDDLQRHNEMDEIGGPAYLTSLTDGAMRGVNLPHYAHIIREHRRRRDVVVFARRVAKQASDTEMSSRELLDAADKELAKLNGLSVGTDLQDQGASLGSFMDHLDHRMHHKEELLGVSTGFPSIDELTCGLVPGELTVAAAGTGGGKTALMLQIASNVASHKLPTVYVSLEMSREQLNFRVASAGTGIDLMKIRRGWLTEQELEAVCLYMATTCTWPFYIDDTSLTNVRELRAKCRRLHAATPVKLIVVDYVQLLTAERAAGGRGENRTVEVGQMSRGLKLLARELNVPIVALSQLTREAKKQKRPPQLEDLRESGSLEQDADNVWFLWDDDSKSDEPTQFIVRKQRQGPTGAVPLEFEKVCVRFVDVKARQSADRVEARRLPEL